MSAISACPPVRLSRVEAADYLCRAGYKITPKTLAFHACRGGGPEYSRWGKAVAYTAEELLRWAQARTAAPRKRQPRRVAA